VCSVDRWLIDAEMRLHKCGVSIQGADAGLVHAMELVLVHFAFPEGEGLCCVLLWVQQR
jgi:hypothetical protein